MIERNNLIHVHVASVPPFTMVENPTFSNVRVNWHYFKGGFDLYLSISSAPGAFEIDGLDKNCKCALLVKSKDSRVEKAILSPEDFAYGCMLGAKLPVLSYMTFFVGYATPSFRLNETAPKELLQSLCLDDEKYAIWIARKKLGEHLRPKVTLEDNALVFTRLDTHKLSNELWAWGAAKLAESFSQFMAKDYADSLVDRLGHDADPEARSMLRHMLVNGHKARVNWLEQCTQKDIDNLVQRYLEKDKSIPLRF